ncbi:MAG: nicotinate-nucleotide adenylyltransferase [Candidatus Omnitrophota bacterium]
MKIGILGGTFNPIHIGHLILAEEAREKLKLDRVVFVPAYLPPHKNNSNIAPARHRLAMIKLAIQGNNHFFASGVEIKRGGRSYTIDTLKKFQELYPKDQLYFITGSDLLNYLDEWKDLKEIVRMVKFVTATRPGYPLDKIPHYITTIGIRAVDISGFEVRQCIKKKKSFRYLVAESVYKYIIKYKLYN